MTTPAPHEKFYQKYAWIILFLLSALLVVNIVIVAGVVDRASEFQDDTGVTWQELSTAYPGVADAYVRNQQLLFLGFGNLGLIAMIVTYFSVRQRQRWAWFAMWLLATTLALTALLFGPFRRPDPGAFYAAFAAIMAIGLLLPIRKFFPGRPSGRQGGAA